MRVKSHVFQEAVDNRRLALQEFNKFVQLPPAEAAASLLSYSAQLGSKRSRLLGSTYTSWVRDRVKIPSWAHEAASYALIHMGFIPTSEVEVYFISAPLLHKYDSLKIFLELPGVVNWPREAVELVCSSIES